MSVTDLEVLRKNALRACILAFLMVLLVEILAFYFVGSKVNKPGFIITLGFIFYGIIVTKPIKKFKKAFKNKFVVQAMSGLFTNFTFDPDNGMPKEIISNTGMMNMGNRYSSNDYITGVYKSVNFVQADVLIQEESSDSEGGSSTVTLFQGQWMIFSFNKTFKANVQVCEKKFRNAKRGSIFSKTKYNKVELEDMEFNKLFGTYAQNDEDAFYILSPVLMDRLKNLIAHTNGNLLLCFINNELHIGVQNGKDSFEPSIFKKIDEEKVLAEVNTDLKEIIKFIDELNLDNDLFRKEV